MLQEFSGDFIQWLRGFYYTATCGNMTAAMKEMHRNQSAITYQIKSLEKEFGVKLFTGTKNNRVLTEEGKLLLSKASQLFAFINELREQMAHMPSDVHGELRIIAMFSFYNHLLPQLVERFANRHQGILLRLMSAFLESQLFEEVAANRVDMGILASNRIPEDFLSVPLFLTELVLITPKNVILEPDGFRLEDLTTLPLGASAPKSSLWLNISLQCQQYGISLRPKHIIDHQDCLLRCVASGLCSTILDSFVVEDILQPGQFNVYSLQKFFRPRQYYLIMQKNMPYQYPQVKAFLNFLLNEFEVTLPSDS